MKTKQQPAKSTTTRTKASKVFSADERAAMVQRAKEVKEGDGARDLLAAIAEMKDSDRAIAERLHAAITASFPEVELKTYYGMPAYAKQGGTVCWFKPAHKFKTRYATFGFSDKAKLDDGNVWPTEYAIQKLTAADEAKIVGLVKKALS